VPQSGTFKNFSGFYDKNQFWALRRFAPPLFTLIWARVLVLALRGQVLVFRAGLVVVVALRVQAEKVVVL